jgi:hypothetical protein
MRSFSLSTLDPTVDASLIFCKASEMRARASWQDWRFCARPNQDRKVIPAATTDSQDGLDVIQATGCVMEFIDQISYWVVMGSHPDRYGVNTSSCQWHGA